jgi:hypothetical protein
MLSAFTASGSCHDVIALKLPISSNEPNKIKRPPLPGWRLRICWRPFHTLFRFLEKWGVHPILRVGKIRTPKIEMRSKLETEQIRIVA